MNITSKYKLIKYIVPIRKENSEKMAKLPTKHVRKLKQWLQGQHIPAPARPPQIGGQCPNNGSNGRVVNIMSFHRGI